MKSQADFDGELIGRIYAAAGDPSAIPDLALDLAHAFDSSSCIVYFRRKQAAPTPQMPVVTGVLSATGNIDDKACAAYATHYGERDEWYQRGWKRPSPQVVLGEELISTNDVLRTEWSDWLHATGCLHVLGVQFPIEGNVFGAIGIHRTRAEGSLEEADRQRMIRLLPHLQRAMRIRERLRAAEQAAEVAGNATGRMGVGIVVVDADRRILFINPAAERTVRTGGGLRIAGGRLAPLAAADEAAFSRAVRHASGSVALAAQGKSAARGATLHLSMGGGAKLAVLIAPLTASALRYDCIGPGCAVIFSDPAIHAPELPPQALAARYGVTPAQARLLSALARGETLADYAARTGVGIGTIRSHLKDLAARTGQRRQADLVRMALSDPLLRLQAGGAAEGVSPSAVSPREPEAPSQ